MENNNNTEIESLETAQNALGDYIEGIEQDIATMQKAVKDCLDNMGSDEYSKKAAEILEKSLNDLNDIVQRAMEIKEEIHQEIIVIIENREAIEILE